MKPLPGQLRISCLSGDGRDDMISITLVDKSSHCEAMEILLSKQAFADAVFGAWGVPCDYEFRDDCPMGKVREHKTVEVHVPYLKNYHKREENAEEALKPHEVDGWKGRVDDACNHYNRTRSDANGGWFNVVFVRYVDMAEGK